MLRVGRKLAREVRPIVGPLYAPCCVSTEASRKETRVQFYECLPSIELRNMSEVGSFLERANEHLPTSTEEWIQTSHLLSSYFILHHYHMSPSKELTESLKLIQVAELWGQFFSHLEFSGHFQEDPSFWVWSAIEAEIILSLKDMGVKDCVRIYDLFWQNQKGTQKLWDMLTWKFALITEAEWTESKLLEDLPFFSFNKRLY